MISSVGSGSTYTPSTSSASTSTTKSTTSTPTPSVGVMSAGDSVDLEILQNLDGASDLSAEFLYAAMLNRDSTPAANVIGLNAYAAQPAGATDSSASSTSQTSA